MFKNTNNKHLLFLLLSYVIITNGCAVSLSETKPARVLNKGEVQLVQANNLSIPTKFFSNIIESGQDAIDHVEAQGTSAITDVDKNALIGAAVAQALGGAGMGTHFDGGFGVGHQMDLSVRLGNGIYALGWRRGFLWGGKWDANIGLRLGYNSGTSWVPLLNDLNEYAQIAKMKRLDAQLAFQLGREFAQVFKWWLGAKTMLSPYSGEIDAEVIGLGKTSFNDHLTYLGGFAGLALGYRYIHAFLEMGVYKSIGDVQVAGYDYSLTDYLIIPSWGLQVSF